MKSRFALPAVLAVLAVTFVGAQGGTRVLAQFLGKVLAALEP